MRVVKIFDNDCDVCRQMAKFDEPAVLSLSPDLSFETKELNVILDPDNESADDCLVAQFAERYACNPDYTIDLPVYMLLEGKKYVGVLIGEHTSDALKQAMRAMIADEKNSKGDSIPR